ncbi:MAG: hypothetical protein JWO07_448 [Candidatus Saccharibacteria bacterium]|nr:hypothetical protein [Candidatus Saccharibacteria bacterium]
MTHTEMPKLPTAGYDSAFIRQRQANIERSTAQYEQAFREQPGMANVSRGTLHWMAQFAATRERAALEQDPPPNRMNTAQSVYRFEPEGADN